MSTKMQGVVNQDLGWQQLGSSWDAVSSIPTVSQLGTYQSLSPSSVTSHHISPALPKFGWHGCSFLTKRSSQVVKLMGDGEVVMTSWFHCSLELIAPRQAATPIAYWNSLCALQLITAMHFTELITAMYFTALITDG